LNAAGECELKHFGEDDVVTEITFADGIARVRCPRPAEDFKCYKVKDLKNPALATPPLALADQFGVNDGVFDAKKPFLLCNPSEMDEQPIFDPATHLVCYKISGPKLDAAERPRIETVSRFGTSQLELTKPAVLCVPSSKSLLP
jgi:hypothetical protein